MYRAIAKNKRTTVFIILLFLLIIGGLGVLAGYVYGWSTSWVVISIAVAYAAIQYFAASRLAISISGGQEIQKAGNGDCLKGEFAGGGAGLLSLPFWLLAEARGKCAR